jgi:hypothetical protein
VVLHTLSLPAAGHPDPNKRKSALARRTVVAFGTVRPPLVQTACGEKAFVGDLPPVVADPCEWQQSLAKYPIVEVLAMNADMVEAARKVIV